MVASIGRVALVAVSLLGLAGCVTTSESPVASGEAAGQSADTAGETTGALADAAAGAETTGTVAAPLPTPSNSPPVTPDLLGKDPNDDLSIAKQYFRQGSYGLAERYFRRAVELHPRDAESWIGLAASYDRLRRFDLADRAYVNATKLIGRTPELLNNQGFSYMLRGDYARARETLLAAQLKDPRSPYIANNLKLLEASERKAKGIN